MSRPSHAPKRSRRRAPFAQEGVYLYRVRTVRAAPGALNDLIHLYAERMDLATVAGDPGWFWMRHSQGDQWDLLLMEPMESFAAWHAPDRAGLRQVARGGSRRDIRTVELEILRHTDWQEDLYAWGVDVSRLRERFSGAGLYHVEMFVGISTLRDALLEQRRMENDFLRALGRDENLVFARHSGSPFDYFTIGFYESLLDYAQQGIRSEADREAAAREAGFESAGTIGTYLRSLISSHQDTLAVPPR